MAPLLVAGLVWTSTQAADDKTRAIEALLASYHDMHVFNGSALVSENGKVTFEKGFGMADFEWQIPNTADTKFRLGSITKQFTATLIMQLVEEKRLSLETTLVGALPYYRKDTGSQVTIHHLLNHTSGIPSYTDLPDFEKDISRNPYPVREFVETYCSGDLQFEPGTKFRYNNSGYFLLGAIIEHITGKRYETVLKERVLDPVGMHASGYDSSEAILPKRARGYKQGLTDVANAAYLDMSIPYAAGSLYSTVEDLYLWDQALYGEKVLPATAKVKMFTPGLENYAYGWVVQKRPIGPGKAERLAISHGGGINGFNTVIARVPEDHQLVVLLNNTGGTYLNVMLDGILDILYGRPPGPAKRPAATALYDTIRTSGVSAAVAQYRDIKATHAAEYELGAGQLERLGQELLQQKRVADAIEIFKLNVEAFPAMAFAHASLANAYQAAGDTDLAIKTYTKALELDPGNVAIAEKLKELNSRRQ